VNTPLPHLGDLLHDAVDDIEPADRIETIRARTASSPTRAARPWAYAAGGVVLATAAAVTAFPLTDCAADPTHHHDHGTMVSPPPETRLVPAYFLGESPRGQRLFREFDRSPGNDQLAAALTRIQRPATDPDYTTAWSYGSLVSATVRDGVIDVELGDANPDLAADGLPVQQVVYTLQGAVGERLPVQFLHEGDLVAGPIEALPQTEVLNQVMINDPTEGLEVHGTFTARGAANSFEATVPWEIRDRERTVVKKGFATAAGNGDRLYAWQARIDVRGLLPGFYTFVAMTDDPSGGAEGSGPDSDTRTIIVR
jgi:Immunoglobulin-like domain of bacterial spore germination/Sporulation and spore germination